MMAQVTIHKASATAVDSEDTGATAYIGPVAPLIAAPTATFQQ